MTNLLTINTTSDDILIDVLPYSEADKIVRAQAAHEADPNRDTDYARVDIELTYAEALRVMQAAYAEFLLSEDEQTPLNEYTCRTGRLASETICEILAMLDADLNEMRRA